jgi:hypothetical protein
MPRKPRPKPKAPAPAEPKPHRHAVVSSVMDGNGHQTALTPERAARLIEELKVGDWPALAALRADVAPTSLYRWVRWGCEPAAVEPYASFAADFVKVEAKLAGEMMAIVMAAARGGAFIEKGEARPDPEMAIWVLQNRFRYLWSIDKDGKQGGISVLETVIEAVAANDNATREQAKAILAAIPEATKQEARKKGFLLK